MKRKHTTEEIRQFILDNVEDHPSDISSLTLKSFDISRQSVNRHLTALILGGLLKAEGQTRRRNYFLKPVFDEQYFLINTSSLDEDQVWREKILPHLENESRNVIDICHYGFTEIMNNVIDHSESSTAIVEITIYANSIILFISDTGVGIFYKIYKKLHLDDERHAVLELSKGKITTDSSKHTGEGIFFTSRMFDKFSIISGSLYFSRQEKDDDQWLLQDEDDPVTGTGVTMIIRRKSKRTVKEVFDRYTSEDSEYGFTRTHVPVRLAQYGGEQLVSRSQAKRLLSRLEPFKEIWLDFKGVDYIGQAFADEIFRVYRNDHPNIELIWTNTNQDVENMIKRAYHSLPGDDQLRLSI